ncbi:sensor histidine kinase [Nocardia sp. GAS34]|uniref:sensor histidine kinase n=1 Tax=unclassified Nocardia TaxID=2637762 RepID=UPI003D1B5DAA
MTLAGQVFLVQLVVLVVVIAAGSALAVWEVRREQDDATRQRVVGIAVSVAQAPSTIAAVRTPDPTALLQPVTERIRVRTGVDFIVVMAPDRTRYTHTDVTQIGKPFSGTIDRALAGATFTETYTGTLGPSIRAVTPVVDGGRVIALVSAGVTRARIGDEVLAQLPLILGVAAAGLLLAVLGALLFRRRLLRQTHGLGPAELRILYEHHDAVLHSVHEGLVVFDRDAEVAAVVNDEARRLLDLPDGPVRRTDLPVSLRRLESVVVRDEMHVTPERVLVVNQDIVTWSGRRRGIGDGKRTELAKSAGWVGTVLTVRDHTELRDIMGELDSARGLAESLRAQSHESANRLHAVITMVELGQFGEAVDFATAELQLSQALIDRLTAAVHEPALAALLLGKVDQAIERGVELTVGDDTRVDSAAPLTVHEMITLVGNLVDNALDAVARQPDAWVEVTVRAGDSDLLVRVADSGPGMSADAFARATERGYSTKSDHHGLGLALVWRLVARHGGTLEAERTPESAVVVRIPR